MSEHKINKKEDGFMSTNKEQIKVKTSYGTKEFVECLLTVIKANANKTAG